MACTTAKGGHQDLLPKAPQSEQATAMGMQISLAVVRWLFLKQMLDHLMCLELSEPFPLLLSYRSTWKFIRRWGIHIFSPRILSTEPPSMLSMISSQSHRVTVHLLRLEASLRPGGLKQLIVASRGSCHGSGQSGRHHDHVDRGLGEPRGHVLQFLAHESESMAASIFNLRSSASCVM